MMTSEKLRVESEKLFFLIFDYVIVYSPEVVKDGIMSIYENYIKKIGYLLLQIELMESMLVNMIIKWKD